jgi:hypothetical protein
MASNAEQRAASVFHPLIAADPTGYDGTFRGSITTASQNMAIPAAIRGLWLKLFAGAAVQFGFGNGTTAPTLVYDQQSTLGTGHVSSGGDIPAGGIDDARIPPDATFIVWIGAANGGKFAGRVSEKPAP